MERPIFIAAALLIPVLASGAEALSIPPKVAAVTPLSVTSRDGSGRASRFVDTRNREFSVRYDANKRVEAVESTGLPNVLDILSIKYSDRGQLLAVSYRTGYSIFFDHRPNGAQVVRDTNGAGIIRTQRSYQSIGPSVGELDARLFASVSEIEALLVALGGRK